MANKFKQGDKVIVKSGKYKGKLSIIILYNIKKNKVLISKKTTAFKTVVFIYVHISNISHFDTIQGISSKILFKSSVISFKSRFHKNSGHILSYYK